MSNGATPTWNGEGGRSECVHVCRGEMRQGNVMQDLFRTESLEPAQPRGMLYAPASCLHTIIPAEITGHIVGQSAACHTFCRFHLSVHSCVQIKPRKNEGFSRSLRMAIILVSRGSVGYAIRQRSKGRKKRNASQDLMEALLTRSSSSTCSVYILGFRV